VRVTGFDLGITGAVFRAERTEDGLIKPLSCERWSFPSSLDEERYAQFRNIARVEVDWADALAYEHVQFNRGKSLIEGFRGIMLAYAQAIGKKKMAMALMIDYPEFMEKIDKVVNTGKRDDLVDAAWVAIWLLEEHLDHG